MAAAGEAAHPGEGCLEEAAVASLPQTPSLLPAPWTRATPTQDQKASPPVVLVAVAVAAATPPPLELLSCAVLAAAVAVAWIQESPPGQTQAWAWQAAPCCRVVQPTSKRVEGTGPCHHDAPSKNNASRPAT